MTRIHINFQNSCLIIVFFLILSAHLTAQTDSDEEYVPSRLNQVDISFDYSMPLGSLKNKMLSDGVGFTFSYISQAKVQSPVFIGISIDWNRYLSASDTFLEFIDGVFQDIDRTTSSNSAGMDFLVRYYLGTNIPFIEPYIEGRFGSKFLYTSTTLTIAGTGENLDFSFEETSFNFNYGMAAGFQLNIYNYNYYLNAKAIFSQGTSASFYALAEGAGNANPPISNFELKNGPISLLRIQLGLTFAF